MDDPTPSRAHRGSAEQRLRQVSALAVDLLQNDTLEDVLWTVTERIAGLLDLEDCVVYLVEGEVLVQVAAYGLKSRSPRQIHNAITIPLGQGVTGAVALSGESRLVCDTRAEPDYIEDEFSGRSELAVPIRFEGRVLGVFDTESATPSRFDESTQEDLEFLVSLVAPRIGSALANRERERAEERLRKAHDDLEARVAERTAELSGVVGELEAEISERRKMEDELRESEAKYKALFDGTADPIFIIDRETRRFLDCNQTALARYGYSRAELLAMTPQDLQPETSLPLISLDPSPHQIVHATRDGTRLQVEIHSDSIRYRGREALISVVRDVTERRRADEARRRLESKMQHAQKLESLGVLAGGIAHDFNNLLVGILGNASLSLAELPKDSRHRASLREIERAARRAAELANQLLAYSGRGKFEVRPFDLNRVIDEMIPLLRSSVSKRAVLETRLSPDLPAVEGDLTQIRQVLMNLIINASDALGAQDGAITVSTHALETDRETLSSWVLAEGLQEGPYVHLQVSDTGCGLTSEAMEKIFDPFFTTKFAGRGLGMAAVLGIVRGHRGAIRIRSEPGEGADFHVLLPACARSEDAPEAPRETLPRQSSGTVLVVDDEPAVRVLARAILERLGFEVLVAGDGRQALDVFSEHVDDVRLVLLDLTMPSLGGEDTLMEMRRLRRNLPVVLSSGYTADDLLEGVAVEAFLQKPYGVPELTRAVRIALGQAVD